MAKLDQVTSANPQKNKEMFSVWRPMAFLENYSRETHFPEGKHFPSADIGRYAKRPLTDGVISAMACQQQEYTSSCTLFGALGPARLVHLRLTTLGEEFYATEDLLSCVRCGHIRGWLQFSFGPGGRT
jgi:hypothetical protein